MAPLNSWEVIEPANYFKSFVDQSSRPDGRDWNTARPISVRVGSIGTAEGSATVRLGNTTIVCGVKAELCRPSLEHPTRGFVVPNVELYPCCSSTFKAGPPGEKAISTSQFLQRLLQNNEIIDYEQLCVVPNKWAWCLYCDILCLDYDGNLIDSSLLSLVAALLHLSLPTVNIDPDTEALSLSQKHTQKLTIKERPMSTTFAVYNSDIQLLDPSAADEAECGGEVSVVLMESGDVCSIRKTGGRQVSSGKVQGFISTAQSRLSGIHETLKEALELHASANRKEP
ncbi:exosome complex component RRP43-like isoform X2 [Hyalella azteca]|uniref:Ribosomal RNA-processing protein 43 n=1 Tax=Hyalella azteca TaxID=294128 RepID=A0A8B7PLJ9_HYAAZ|nr:exosome complex component RRP43-like isoform X2 [Hyalella azteca]